MIRYEVVAPHLFQKVGNFMRTNLYREEPIAVALGLSQTEVGEWICTYIEALLQYSDPISYAAIDEESGEMVGALVGVVHDTYKPDAPPTMLTYLSPLKEPVMLQIATLLEELRGGLDIRGHFGMPPTSKVFSTVFFSVKSENNVEDIGTHLLLKAMAKAKEISNCFIAMSEYTSNIALNIFLKHDYRKLMELEYQMYRDLTTKTHIFAGKEEVLGTNEHATLVANLL